MILLDTHIWVWWVNESKQLPQRTANLIAENVENSIGISIISCWEIAKLVENNRLKLAYPAEQWLNSALSYPGVALLNLTPQIVVESTQLPGEFHKDPADQLNVYNLLQSIGEAIFEVVSKKYFNINTPLKDTERVVKRQSSDLIPNPLQVIASEAIANIGGADEAIKNPQKAKAEMLRLINIRNRTN